MTGSLHPVDIALIGAYAAFLVYVGVRLFGEARQDAVEYLVMGRRLALPSFVATLVTTWYGGVLGVGEYSYRYGLSNWLVFGVPYYVGAALFALYFAKRARESRLYTVPDQMARAYGRPAGILSAAVLQFLSSPAPYVLMLGILIQMIFHLPLWACVLTGMFFSTCYSLRGGMRSWSSWSKEMPRCCGRMSCPEMRSAIRPRRHACWSWDARSSPFAPPSSRLRLTPIQRRRLRDSYCA